MQRWEEWEGRALRPTNSAREFGFWLLKLSAEGSKIAFGVVFKLSLIISYKSIDYPIKFCRWAIPAWRRLYENLRKEAEARELQRQAAAKAAWEASPAARRAAAMSKWEQEVDALRESMCKTPPERMLATIKVYEWTHDPPMGHWVDLFLVPSEEERAIILKFHLDTLVLESDPKYSKEELEHLEQVMPSRLRAIGKDFEDGREWARETFNQKMREARAARFETQIFEYFDFPYSRAFRTAHEAHTYASKLRDELLPRVRGLVEDYKMRRNEETFSV